MDEYSNTSFWPPACCRHRSVSLKNRSELLRLTLSTTLLRRWAWSGLLQGALAYTLDGTNGTTKTHVRSIPTDGHYDGDSYVSLVHDNAIVWEGSLPPFQPPQSTPTSTSSSSSPPSSPSSTSSVRFVVSGLNLLDNGGVLQSGPQALAAMRALIDYTVGLAARCVPLQLRISCLRLIQAYAEVRAQS